MGGNKRDLNRDGGSGSNFDWYQDRIEAELNRDLSLSILAKESGYSRTHFQGMFRAAMGLTPHQYLLERRIGRAQELLEKKTASLIDVAASCGFSSHSHMTTVFRKLLGLTPDEYRRLKL